MPVFFIIFVLVPLSEVMVFVSVSAHIGLGTALLLSLITAVIGGALVRYQGMITVQAAHESLQKGHLPSKELFDGLCLVAAGATLITPGFITDALGFALLVPPVREALRRFLVNSGKFQTTGFHSEYTEFRDEGAYGQADIVDVEYETLDEQGKETRND